MLRKNIAGYNSWRSMLARCKNKKFDHYGRYGGRGIFVCHRWESFDNFIRDMGTRPHGAQIDRIDNNIGYFPWNCRWTTVKENCRNKSNNKIVTYKGKTMCLTDWAAELGVPMSTLHHRLYVYGWKVERAFTESNNVKYYHSGLCLTLCEWANKLGMTHQTLWTRLNKLSWPIDRALSQPVKGKALRTVI